MYRNDLDASFARANALQNELTATQHASTTQPIYASRSGAILTLGILAVVVCSILGPFAWVMGNEELRRMRAGQTPSDGWSSVVAGRVLGIIGTVLIVGLAFVLLTMGTTTYRHY